MEVFKFSPINAKAIKIKKSTRVVQILLSKQSAEPQTSFNSETTPTDKYCNDYGNGAAKVESSLRASF